MPAPAFKVRTVDGSSFSRQASFVPETVNKKTSEVDVTWTTGARVLRVPWDDEPYHEELSTDPNHVRLERLENGAPLLDSHHADRLDDQIGSVVRVWFEDGVGRATVRFRSNKKSQEIFQDVVNGTIRNLSIGYLVYQFTERQIDTNAAYRTLLATDYEVYELSFVPIPADPGAQTRSKKPSKNSNPIQIRSLEQMTTKNKNLKTNPETTPDSGTETPATRGATAAAPTAPPQSPDNNTVDLDQVRKAAVAAEKQRTSSIKDFCVRGGLSDTFANELIDGDVPLETARERIFQKMLDKDAGETRTANSRVVAGDLDEIETRRNALANAILHRKDPANNELHESAYQYRGMSLVEIAKECLDKRGIVIASRRRTEIAQRAFHSTSDFPAILANISHKTLLGSFERLVQRQTFQPLVRIGNAPDFKEMTKVRLGEHPSFKEIPEGAEVHAGTLGESKESYRIATYGRKIGITRQAIINDDLSAFNALGNFGAAGARLESLLVWSIFLDNPRMGDGKLLFSAAHGNLTGADDPQELGEIALSEGEYKMSVQVGIDKKDYLNIPPKYIIVPSRMKTEALKLVNKKYNPTTQEDYNPFEDLMVISEPRLNTLIERSGDKYTKKPWFLAADQGDGVDMIELSYLDGIRAPQVETRTDFDTGSFEVKAWLDIGAKALDWRGLYKSEGNLAA